MSDESVFEMSSALDEARHRILTTIGPASMVVSCDSVLDAAQRIEELEDFIKSNCYDMPGQASVRAKEILNKKNCTRGAY